MKNLAAHKAEMCHHHLHLIPAAKMYQERKFQDTANVLFE